MSLFTSAQMPGEPLPMPAVELLRRAGTDDIRTRLMAVAELIDEVKPWQALSDQALEPNIFYDPPFALASILHIAEGPLPRVLVVEKLTARGFVWIGFFPHGHQRLNGGPRITRGFRNRQMALGTPLVHKDHAETAIAAWLDWLESEASSAVAMLPLLRMDGPFANLLWPMLNKRKHEIRLFDSHRRAILPGRQDAEAYFETHWRTKKLKELRRQRRRLAETGPVTVDIARKGAEVHQAIENFLILEAAGWKGERATALVQEPGRAAFARATLRGLIRQDRLMVMSLKAGETIIAIGLVLKHGERAYFWKLAFDENFAAASPGVQFVQELTRVILADHKIAAMDSCAIADHPMIDHLWRDRQPMADLLISAGAPAWRWHVVRLQESLARSGRAKAKQLWHWLRGDRR
jgi:CelD/BcsL family acetyltransferase involved in cellulose biosynthesis